MEKDNRVIVFYIKIWKEIVNTNENEIIHIKIIKKYTKHGSLLIKIQPPLANHHALHTPSLPERQIGHVLRGAPGRPSGAHQVPTEHRDSRRSRLVGSEQEGRAADRGPYCPDLHGAGRH